MTIEYDLEPCWTTDHYLEDIYNGQRILFTRKELPYTPFAEIRGKSLEELVVSDVAKGFKVILWRNKIKRVYHIGFNNNQPMNYFSTSINMNMEIQLQTTMYCYYAIVPEELVKMGDLD